MIELRLSEVELAFLGQSEPAAEEGATDQSEDAGALEPIGYRERLALGDLSW